MGLGGVVLWSIRKGHGNARRRADAKIPHMETSKDCQLTTRYRGPKCNKRYTVAYWRQSQFEMRTVRSRASRRRPAGRTTTSARKNVPIANCGSNICAIRLTNFFDLSNIRIEPWGASEMLGSRNGLEKCLFNSMGNRRWELICSSRVFSPLHPKMFCSSSESSACRPVYWSSSALFAV